MRFDKSMEELSERLKPSYMGKRFVTRLKATQFAPALLAQALDWRHT
jgi:hypothetical protein